MPCLTEKPKYIDKYNGDPGNQFQPGPFLKKVYQHVYVSGSYCMVLCVNASFQGGKASVSLTGGLTFDTLKSARNPFSFKGGAFLGVSAGWNTATPDDNATTISGVTVADGWIGGSYSYERGPEGNSFHQFGWAGGAGVAVQGPPLIGFHFGAGGSGWDVNEPPK
ncbi:hypothetical protein ACF9IK_30800 [Kitasatospora hibisci]|uniref:hypothetical protein n=1 Tax=Kitasatospora hibisci TaxID=3369522 RepID=UPI0037548D68